MQLLQFIPIFLLALSSTWAKVEAEERILHAAPVALGKADGSSPANALELQAAFDATRNPKGPITVLLVDRRYRKEYVVPSRKDDNTAPPLTIRAVNSGKAIIDGSDPVTEWTGPDANGVWETSWTEGWGPSTDRIISKQLKQKPLDFRRELVHVNGKPLKIVMASDGIAPVPWRAIEPGQFTVDDVAKAIRLKLLDGGNPKHAQVEISYRGARPPVPGGMIFPRFLTPVV